MAEEKPLPIGGTSQMVAALRRRIERMQPGRSIEVTDFQLSAAEVLVAQGVLVRVSKQTFRVAEK